MCVVCGCSSPGPATGAVDGATAGADSPVAVNPATGDLHYGAGSARVSVPGLSQARALKLEVDVLAANNRIATANRAHFAGHGVRALNLARAADSFSASPYCEVFWENPSRTSYNNVSL